MTGRFGDIKVYFREVKKTEYFANKRSLLKEIKDKYNDIVDWRTSLSRQLLLNTSAKLTLKTLTQLTKLDLEVWFSRSKT